MVIWLVEVVVGTTLTSCAMCPTTGVLGFHVPPVLSFPPLDLVTAFIVCGDYRVGPPHQLGCGGLQVGEESAS